MGALSKIVLSGSTDGKQIKVTGTNSGGANTIHSAGATGKDEIWLYADNDTTSNQTLTIQWGGTTDPDNTMKITIPARGSTSNPDGPICIIPGLLLQNSLTVKAFASTANAIKLSGFVVREAA